jgi:hypothetical protein
MTSASPAAGSLPLNGAAPWARARALRMSWALLARRAPHRARQQSERDSSEARPTAPRPCAQATVHNQVCASNRAWSCARAPHGRTGCLQGTALGRRDCHAPLARGQQRADGLPWPISASAPRKHGRALAASSSPPCRPCKHSNPGALGSPPRLHDSVQRPIHVFCALTFAEEGTKQREVNKMEREALGARKSIWKSDAPMASAAKAFSKPAAHTPERPQIIPCPEITRKHLAKRREHAGRRRRCTRKNATRSFAWCLNLLATLGGAAS